MGVPSHLSTRTAPSGDAGDSSPTLVRREPGGFADPLELSSPHWDAREGPSSPPRDACRYARPKLGARPGALAYD